MDVLRKIGGVMAWVVVVAPALAQEAAPQPRVAVVNGEPVYEATVQRALKNLPKGADLDRARQQYLGFFIDNTLIDQYLVQQKVQATKEDIDARIKGIKQEAAAKGQDFDKTLKDLALSEAEMRAILAADVRWEKYVASKTPEATLVSFFNANKDWFDGSQVRARHVLIECSDRPDDKNRGAAKAKLQDVRRQVEAAGADAIKRADSKTNAAARDQVKFKTMEDAFAAAASKESDCPSKKEGGDIGWFPRVGRMVEPFAKAAFALQPGQLSDVVETPFGCHVIFCTARMPGKDVKFETCKEEVRDAIADGLREDLLTTLRKTAKIELIQPKP